MDGPDACVRRSPLLPLWPPRPLWTSIGALRPSPRVAGLSVWRSAFERWRLRVGCRWLAVGGRSFRRPGIVLAG